MSSVRLPAECTAHICSYLHVRDLSSACIGGLVSHTGPLVDELWQKLARQSKGCRWLSLAECRKSGLESLAKWQLKSKEDLRRYSTAASRYSFLPVPEIWQPFVEAVTSPCSVGDGLCSMKVKSCRDDAARRKAVCLMMAFGVCRGERSAAEISFEAISSSAYAGCCVGVEAIGQTRSLTFLFEPATGQCLQVLRDSSGVHLTSCANLAESLIGEAAEDVVAEDPRELRVLSSSVIINDSGSISFLRRVGTDLQAEPCGEVVPADGAPWVKRYHIFAKTPLQASTERTVLIRKCCNLSDEIPGRDLEAVWKAPNITDMEELEAGVGLEQYDTLSR